MEWNGEIGGWTLLDRTNEVTTAGNERRILQAIRELVNDTKPVAISRQSGLAGPVVRATIARMMGKGAIIRREDGTYGVAAS